MLGAPETATSCNVLQRTTRRSVLYTSGVARGSTQLNVRVPVPLYLAVQLRAAKTGLSQSEITRDALIRYLATPPLAQAGFGEKDPDLQGKHRRSRGAPPQEAA